MERSRVGLAFNGQHDEVVAASIPPLIASLWVTVKVERSTKAVLVVEHKNVKDIFTKQDSFTAENAVVIITTGYPSTATKEFLHLLSLEVVLKDVPFLVL